MDLLYEYLTGMLQAMVVEIEAMYSTVAISIQSITINIIVGGKESENSTQNPTNHTTFAAF